MDEFANPTMSGGEPEDVGRQDTNTQGQDAGPDTSPEGDGLTGGKSAADGADQQGARAVNAAIAAARRRAERDTEERVRRQTDSDIAGYRIPNPAKPGTYFSSKKDLEDYSEALRRADAQQRAKAQGRSVEEVVEEDADRAFIRAQRTAAAKAEEEHKKQQERDSFIAADLEDFQSRYPNVDIASVDRNPAFRRFVGSRYGKEPLANLWGDYVALVGETAAQQRAESADRRARSTGYGIGGSGNTLTAAQRAALKEWNAEHPEMHMTEKEFLEM